MQIATVVGSNLYSRNMRVVVDIDINEKTVTLIAKCGETIQRQDFDKVSEDEILRLRRLLVKKTADIEVARERNANAKASEACSTR